MPHVTPTVVRENVDDVSVEDMDEDGKHSAKQESSKKGLVEASFDRTIDRTPDNVVSVKTSTTKTVTYSEDQSQAN